MILLVDSASLGLVRASGTYLSSEDIDVEARME